MSRASEYIKRKAKQIYTVHCFIDMYETALSLSHKKHHRQASRIFFSNDTMKWWGSRRSDMIVRRAKNPRKNARFGNLHVETVLNYYGEKVECFVLSIKEFDGFDEKAKRSRGRRVRRDLYFNAHNMVIVQPYYVNEEGKLVSYN